MSSELFLSPNDPRPMYQQIVDQLTAKVMAGDWQAGQALPSIREMAAASRVSVITVRRAYEELERAGVIATRQGKGSVVADRSDLAMVLLQAELKQQLEALLNTAARLGLGTEELRGLLDKAAAANGDKPADPEIITGPTL